MSSPVENCGRAVCAWSLGRGALGKGGLGGSGPRFLFGCIHVAATHLLTVIYC